MEERRRFIRITGVKDAWFRVKGASGNFRKVSVKNLSMVGIHFYSPLALEKGTELEIKIGSPEDDSSFTVEGTVIWQIASLNDRFATGIKFIGAQDEREEKLEALINKYAQNVEEQREFIRCELMQDIKFSYVQEPDKKYSAVCADISKGGMKIVVQDRLSGGSRLKVFFELPRQDDSFECEAKVVWFREDKDNGYAAGLIFTKVEERDRDKIWKYIEDRCRK